MTGYMRGQEEARIVSYGLSYLVTCACGYRVGPVRGSHAAARVVEEHGCSPGDVVAIPMLPDAAASWHVANELDRAADHFRRSR